MTQAAYGYLVVPSEEEQRVEYQWRQALLDLAAREGLTVLGVFVDRLGERPDGFAAMLDALRRGNVRYVLVPSITHLQAIPQLSDFGPGAMARHLGVAVLRADTTDSPRPAGRHRAVARP